MRSKPLRVASRNRSLDAGMSRKHAAKANSESAAFTATCVGMGRNVWLARMAWVRVVCVFEERASV